MPILQSRVLSLISAGQTYQRDLSIFKSSVAAGLRHIIQHVPSSFPQDLLAILHDLQNTAAFPDINATAAAILSTEANHFKHVGRKNARAAERKQRQRRAQGASAGAFRGAPHLRQHLSSLHSSQATIIPLDDDDEPFKEDQESEEIVEAIDALAASPIPLSEALSIAKRNTSLSPEAQAALDEELRHLLEQKEK